MKKLPLKTVRSISVAALLVGGFIGLYGSLIDFAEMCIAGCVILILGVLFFLIFFRCPHCGRHLGRDHGPYCQYCGKETGLKSR